MKPSTQRIASSKALAYRDAFVAHVHLLLWMGYSRLRQSRLSELSGLQEPEISGLICENIGSVLDDKDSPPWVDDYEVHDDPPVHNPERLGKHRRRVDIKLVSRRARPRLRFCFESKILRASNSVRKYLGKNGLGRFLAGSYSSDQAIGGMIGYVQSHNCDDWSSKIDVALDPKTHMLEENGAWTVVQITAELPHTYQTIHRRVPPLTSIAIIHTLLDCTGR